MSREILFKAKRKNWRELPKDEWWVEGDLRQDRDLETAFISGWDYYTSESGLEREPFEYEIDPETFCQYTGKTDKNEKKIWENDICNRKEKYPEIVTYNKGDWQLDYSYVFGKEMHTDACNLGFYVCERNCVEVIGNIFDNADLLEVER